MNIAKESTGLYLSVTIIFVSIAVIQQAMHTIVLGGGIVLNMFLRDVTAGFLFALIAMTLSMHGELLLGEI